MNPQQAYEFALLVLAIWRESRGEPLEGKRGVAWSIRNRVQHPGWWGDSWATVILKPFQYSSFNTNDPNATKFPTLADLAIADCMTAAQEAFSGTGEDPTRGATSYYDHSLDANPPAWAATMVRTVDLGRLHFFRLA